MPGTRLARFSARMTASVPTPTARVVQFVRPPATARAMACALATRPSLSIEKPNSFGSWLMNTVSAMPFM